VKERLVTLGLALGAFALFYALFVPKPNVAAEAIAWPTSIETRAAGYQALWRWLQSRGIPVVSLRDRYGRLAQQGAPDSGNILITTLPQQLPFRPDEAESLDQWLERGNTLLVMAAMDDTPAWALRSPGDVRGALQRMTGLSFDVVRNATPPADTASNTSRAEALRQAVQQLIAPQRSSIVAKGAHPLFSQVRSLATQSEYPASRWSAHSTDGSAVLEIGERSDRAEGSATAEPAVWLKRNGQGQIIVVAFASPFSNALIGEQDNARLLANIVAWSRAGRGAVLFDDAHQGLVSYYDAKAFFADSRLHRTLLWICALWLVFVLGWQRLRPHSDSWNPVDVTTFIKVTGGFIAGRVGVNRTGQRLCENFFNRIRQRLALPQNGLPLWDWLDAQASIPARELAQLRRLHALAQTRQRINLIQLQNCLTTIMGILK
jgi:hypothetical protein